MMGRDDITASEACRCHVPEYLKRLEQAYRWLEMAEGSPRQSSPAGGESQPR